jgi:hypothetical protein
MRVTATSAERSTAAATGHLAASVSVGRIQAARRASGRTPAPAGRVARARRLGLLAEAILQVVMRPDLAPGDHSSI